MLIVTSDPPDTGDRYATNFTSWTSKTHFYSVSVLYVEYVEYCASWRFVFGMVVFVSRVDEIVFQSDGLKTY